MIRGRKHGAAFNHDFVEVSRQIVERAGGEAREFRQSLQHRGPIAQPLPPPELDHATTSAEPSTMPPEIASRAPGKALLSRTRAPRLSAWAVTNTLRRRIVALCDAFLSYVQRDVFPGGCFFEAARAECDSRPGPVRDLVMESKDYWSASLVRVVTDAQRVGEVRADIDPAQVGWEFGALLDAANQSHTAHAGFDAAGRARHAIRDRLKQIVTARGQQVLGTP